MFLRIAGRVCFHRFHVKRHLTRCLSFQDLSLDMHYVRRLRKLGITSPTYIQQQTFDAVRNGENIVINSETGSGKTLSYALPILQKILDKKKTSLQKARPTAVVLLPSVELCYQVGHVFQRTLGLNVSLVSNQHAMRLKDTDVVVSTPQGLSTYPYNVLNETETIVIDESDLMIDRRVGKHGRKDPLFNFMKHMLDSANSSFQKDRQFIFVGATLPDSIHKKSRKAMPYIRAWVPDIKVFKGTEAHRMMSDLDITYVDVEEGNKLKALIEVLERLSKTNYSIKILIFVNTVRQANKLHHELTNGQNIHTSNVNIGNETFPQMLTRIANTWSDSIKVIHRDVDLADKMFSMEQFNASNRFLLITTDVMARGLDFQNADVVLQYDFAKNVTDMVHRIGRTGRMGKEGKVINFITSEDKKLASLVQNYSSQGDNLDQLFSRRRGLPRALKNMAK